MNIKMKLIETEEDRTTDYALTILQQIKAADFWALARWGAHDAYLHEHERAVKFKVNGGVHRGWVRIKLGGDDLYTIEIAKDGKREGYVWTVIKTFSGAYDDMLVPVITAMIDGEGN